VATVFGLVLAAMNLSFYEAIARIPLGVAVTIEFSGPLAVALIGSRRWSDGLWALGAGGGVVLLATGAGRHLDPAGLALAMLAGTFWAGYILLSKETGRRFDSLNGLAWAMTTGGLALLPWGLLNAGATLLRPSVLGLGAVVAVMASVIPYSLELLALRRVTPRAWPRRRVSWSSASASPSRSGWRSASSWPPTSAMPWPAGLATSGWWRDRLTSRPRPGTGRP
jgi:inner membrane transporter RhtA